MDGLRKWKLSLTFSAVINADILVSGFKKVQKCADIIKVGMVPYGGHKVLNSLSLKVG